MGPYVSFSAFDTNQHKAYSVQATGPFRKPMILSQDNFRVRVQGKDELWLAIENGNMLLPKKHNLSFSPTYQDGGTRSISALTLYPPLQSNLGIGWSRNMYSWENLGGRLGRWCGPNCLFLAKSCGKSESLDLILSAPRSDISKQNPLSFIVSVFPFKKRGKFSAKALEDLPKPLTIVKGQFREKDKDKLIQVQGTPETAWYLVKVKTNSVYNPKARGESQDDRKLAVFVSEPDCSTTRQ